MEQLSLCKYLLVCCTFFVLSTSAFPQGEFSVEWHGQIPESSIKNYKGNIKWLEELIFGKKPGNLIKPMSVITYNTDSVIIIDQGSGSFFISAKRKRERVNFRNSQFENFPSLVDCCMLPDRTILFTDSQLNKVFKFKLQDNSKRPGLSEINDTLILDQPTGIAYSVNQDKIWVIETGSHRISILDTEGKLVKRFGERGSGPGQFNYPTHLWIDTKGFAYIVDAMNFRIQVFDKYGEFVSSFGEAGDASGYFARPKGIATDSYGHIYIADALFHVIQVFDRDGSFLYDFGEKGKGKEQFMIPSGIFIDDKDYIYVADSYNSRIQVFRLCKNE